MVDFGTLTLTTDYFAYFITMHSVRLTARVTGSATLPDDPADWRHTTLLGTFEATLTDLTPVDVDLDGDLDLFVAN